MPSGVTTRAAHGKTNTDTNLSHVTWDNERRTDMTSTNNHNTIAPASLASFTAATAGTVALPASLLSHVEWDRLTLSIPAHWLCAVLYGDTVGLEDAEAAAFSRWLYGMTQEFGAVHIGKVSEGAYFARYHDAADFGVAACMCHDVEFMLPPVNP